jgi:Arc/MetJ family transcription regulator
MTRRPAARSTGERARKNMDMDAEKLASAQRVLGARSETETVDLALDYVLLQGEVFGALDRLAALGGLDDPFAAAPPRAGRRRVTEP